jgi:hypothetical protein
MSLIPSGVFGGEFLVSGLPSATSRCRLEGALGGMVRDYLFNHQGQQVMPIAGNTFIVVDFLVAFKNGTSTISSKDFYLDGGKARFECVGFTMKVAPDKPPVFVGGTDEATLSIGGEENFQRTGGKSPMTLVFTGPKDYAKGDLKVRSNYPVKSGATLKPKAVPAKASATPQKNGKKDGKKKSKKPEKKPAGE